MDPPNKRARAKLYEQLRERQSTPVAEESEEGQHSKDMTTVPGQPVPLNMPLQHLPPTYQQPSLCNLQTDGSSLLPKLSQLGSTSTQDEIAANMARSYIPSTSEANVLFKPECLMDCDTDATVSVTPNLQAKSMVNESVISQEAVKLSTLSVFGSTSSACGTPEVIVPSIPTPLFQNYLDELVSDLQNPLPAESFLMDFSHEIEALSSRTVEAASLLPQNETTPEPASASVESSRDPSCLPLFDGSPLSVNDCMVSVLTYAQSCHLSGSSTSELLNLLELILPKPNNLPTSSHLFLKHFADDSDELQLFFYCSNCLKPRSSSTDICNECSAPKRRVGYFVLYPLEKQLRKLFKRPGFVDKLNYKHNRVKKVEGNIEDLYDGNIYKETEETGTITPKTITFTMYWDGVSIFECSVYSMTPCMLSINELPPEERQRQENILIGGLWGGDCKPHPNVFLLPIYHELKKVKTGIQVRLPDSDEDVTVNGVLLFGACDTPARSSFMCMKAHSGYWSCPKCFIKGEKSERTGNVMVFPHQEEVEIRDDSNYQECARQGVKLKDGFKGVFGPTVLSYMFSGSFIRGMTIDIMHCAYMGITKQLLKLFFDALYKKEPFSLFEKIDVINDRQRSLQLPHFVQRLPIDLDKCLSYWKASLCRNFILYIVLVIVKDILPEKYFDNLSDLVNGLALLNSSSISESDLEEAESKLVKFSKDFQHLYGLRHMSMNIHLLLHLRQSVADSGNLYVTSCFRFEDLNGKLAGLVHGTRHAIKQISQQLNLLTDLPLLVEKLESDDAKQYCHNMLQCKKNITITCKISEGVFVVGSMLDTSSHLTLVSELVSPLTDRASHLRFFDRLFKHGVLYVSSSYRKGSRLSSYCRYSFEEQTFHGHILTFVNVGEKYFALLERSLDIGTGLFRYVQFHPSMDQDLVPVSALISVSFCLNVDGILYLVDPLNALEME